MVLTLASLTPLLCPPGNVYKFQAGSRFHAILWHKHLDDACRSNRPQVKSPGPCLSPEMPLPPLGPRVPRHQGFLLPWEPVSPALRHGPMRQGTPAQLAAKPGFRPER